MKKILILLLLFLLVGCESRNTKIPLMIYDLDDNFLYLMKDNIMKEELDGFEYELYDAQNSQLIQNEQIIEVLEHNPKLLIINPVDRQSVYTIIEKSNNQNVPIIFINREPLEVDMMGSNNVYYVGAPSENSAILQSELVKDAFGLPNELSAHDKNQDGRIQMIILKGEQGHQDAEIRTEIVIEELEKYGYNLDILAIRTCNWNEANAKDAMHELIDQHGSSIELVISNNDAMAIGAIRALNETGYFNDVNKDGEINRQTEDWIPVIGADGLKDALRMIDEGFLYGTVISDTQRMAKAIGELSQAILDGTNIYDIGFDITDEKYIWIDYNKYGIEEAAN